FGASHPLLGGVVGFEMNDYLQDYIGQIGTMLVVLFLVIFYLIFRVKMAPKVFTNVVSNTHARLKDNLEKAEEIISTQPVPSVSNQPIKQQEEKPNNQSVHATKEIAIPTVTNEVAFELNKTDKKADAQKEFSVSDTTSKVEHHEEFIIETIEEEEPLTDDLSNKIAESFGLFDPTLELSKYQFPTSYLLYEHATGGMTINQIGRASCSAQG